MMGGMNADDMRRRKNLHKKSSLDAWLNGWVGHCLFFICSQPSRRLKIQGTDVLVSNGQKSCYKLLR